jgi:hypothetical protein
VATWTGHHGTSGPELGHRERYRSPAAANMRDKDCKREPSATSVEYGDVLSGGKYNSEEFWR